MVALETQRLRVKLQDLAALLLILGYPKMPIIGFPLAFLILPFYVRAILTFLNKNSVKVAVYGLIYLFFLWWGALAWNLGSGDLVDFIFFGNISFKIFMDFIFGIIAGFVLSRNFSILLLWLLIQSIMIICSMFSLEVYTTLVKFISSSSAAVFESIYSLKAIGFGLYHTSGATVFLLAAIFYFTLRKKVDKFWHQHWLFFSFISLLVSRSSIILTAIFGVLFRRSSLIVMTFCLFVAAFLAQEGVIFRVTELFRNIAQNGSFHMESTNQNMDMFIFPSYSLEMLFGAGEFFEKSGALEFYKGTDLGVSRLSLYGGWLFFFMFVLLNCFWAYLCTFKVYRKNYRIQYLSIVMMTFFVIMLFKDISFISVFSTCLYYFAWDESRRSMVGNDDI